MARKPDKSTGYCARPLIVIAHKEPLSLYNIVTGI